MKDKRHAINLSRRSFLFGGAATLAGAGLALSGCGNGSNSGNSSASIDSALAYSETVVNPVGNTTATFNTANWHVFEGLYCFNPTTNEVYNGLAALDPKKIDDLTYEITLRDEAKFSDGTKVSAADVVFSCEANLKDPIYGPLLEFLKSAEVKDDKTVVLHLTHSYSNLLKNRLTLVKVFPKNSTTDQLKTMPIGSGPWAYKYIDATDGGHIDFVKNDYYNGKYPASSNEMSMKIMLDNTSRSTALTDKTVVAIENVDYVNSDQLMGAGAKVEYTQTPSMAAFFFNTLKAPFNDKRVRQVFYYAINVEKLIANQLAGHAQAATCLIPDYLDDYKRANTVYSYDPEKAKSLLEQAGATNLSLTLKVNTNWVKDLAPQIKNDLDAVGINCNLDVSTFNWNLFNESDTVLPFDVLLTPGDFGVFGDDADIPLTYWFGDNTWTKGRTCWQKSDHAKWEELNTMIKSARIASNQSEQKTIWGKCFDLISEEVPLYPLLHRDLGTGYWNSMIKNFKTCKTTGLYFLGTSLN